MIIKQKLDICMYVALSSCYVGSVGVKLKFHNTPLVCCLHTKAALRS